MTRNDTTQRRLLHLYTFSRTDARNSKPEHIKFHKIFVHSEIPFQPESSTSFQNIRKTDENGIYRQTNTQVHTGAHADTHRERELTS